MASDILGILVFVSLVSAIAGCATTYQGNPKGKKWLCVIPVAVYIVVVYGSAFALGIMTGRKIIDVEASRVISIGLYAFVTIVCLFFFFKYRSANAMNTRSKGGTSNV